MKSRCKGCGHDQYDGGSHECPELKRTVYHYDQPCFEDVEDPAPVAEVVEIEEPKVLTDAMAAS